MPSAMRAMRKITCSRRARLTASIGTVIKSASAKSSRVYLSASFLPISQQLADAVQTWPKLFHSYPRMDISSLKRLELS